MDSNSYWEERFKVDSEKIIMHLMKQLGVTQLDFSETELEAQEGFVFIGLHDNKFRLTVLDKGSVIVGGDCD